VIVKSAQKSQKSNEHELMRIKQKQSQNVLLKKNISLKQNASEEMIQVIRSFSCKS
jgi:hypothetical protein